MIVVHKIYDKFQAINLDNVTTIECEAYEGANYGIYFNFIDGQGVMLASYPQLKAKELYNELIRNWASGYGSYYELP